MSNTQLNQLSEPAIVRVLDGCEGIYRFADEDLSSAFERETASISSGSGFLINPNGYIVTNAHVVSDTREAETRQDSSVPTACEERLFDDFVRQIAETLKYEENHYLNNPDSLKYLRERSNLVTFSSVNKVILPSGSKALSYSIEKYGEPIGEGAQVQGKDVAVIKVQLEKAPTLALSDDGLPKSGTDVLMMGYPYVADDSDLFDDDSNVQMSSISADVSSIKETKDGVNVIQISGTVSQGISGGPVINRQGEVVGIVTFGKTDSEGISSIPSAISTATVKEFLPNVGDKRGEVDQYYREGLELFWAKDYRRAKLKFDQVEGLFEDHSEVKELIKEANIAISSNALSSDSSSASPLLWIILASLLGLLIIAVAGVMIGKFYFQRSSSAEPASSHQAASSVGLSPQVSSPRNSSVRPSLSQMNNSSATRVHNPSSSNGAASQPDIVFTNGAASSAWLELEYKGEIKRLNLSEAYHQFGRDTSWANLNIPNDWGVVSGRHAILQREGANYRIYDGDGQGRTSSNGLKSQSGDVIDNQTGLLLEHGDQLEIGRISGDQVKITYFNPTSVQRTYDPTQVEQ